MLHRFLTTLAVASVCLCASPAVPNASTAPPDESEPTFDAAPLPSDAEFARAARTDPLLMLNLVAKRYKIAKSEGDKQAIAVYTASFHKRERIGGELHPQEVIRVAYREEPYAVLMHWEQGSRRHVEGTLFAAGQNEGKMLVKHRFLGVLAFDPKGSNPRSSARYTIEEFGFYHSTKRALRAWTHAASLGSLQWSYVGTRNVPDASNRECHIVMRTCAVDEIDAFAGGEASPPITASNRADSVRTVTLYFDAKTWLQVGSELRRADGELSGSYFFRDVTLNPSLPADSFTRAALRK